LEKELQERKNFDIRVTSAGTAALEGILPSQDTIKVLGEVGIEADKYRSRRLTEEMLKEADLVLTMEKIHLDYILAQDMQLKCKTFGFLKFAFGLEDEVQDPIGKGIDEYRKVFFLIKEAVAEIIKKIT
jgi:protein-tyrosine-phosphatase